MDKWVVVLEASEERSDPPLDPVTLKLLLSELATFDPTALYAPDRYALQLLLPAASPSDALSEGTERWRRAVGRVGLREWQLVRAEVKTLAELDSEHLVDQEEVPPVLNADAVAVHAAHHATRQLLRIRSAAEVPPIIWSLISRLGGHVVPKAIDDPSALSISMPFGELRHMAPAAEPLSVARLHIEEILPPFIEDAQRVVSLIDRR